jgi:hypothetical protein
MRSNLMCYKRIRGKKVARVSGLGRVVKALIAAAGPLLRDFVDNFSESEAIKLQD